jgi:hypothetical protein
MRAGSFFGTCLSSRVGVRLLGELAGDDVPEPTGLLLLTGRDTLGGVS